MNQDTSVNSGDKKKSFIRLTKSINQIENTDVLYKSLVETYQVPRYPPNLQGKATKVTIKEGNLEKCKTEES